MGPLVLVEGQILSLTLQLQAPMDGAVLNLNTTADPVSAATTQPPQLMFSAANPSRGLDYQATQPVAMDTDIFQTLTGGGTLSGMCPGILRIRVLDADQRVLVVNTPAGEVWEREPGSGAPTQFNVTVEVGAQPLMPDGLAPGSVDVTLEALGFDVMATPVTVQGNQAPYEAVFTLSRVDNNTRDPPTFVVTAGVATTTDPVWQRAGAVQQQGIITVLDDERRSFFTATRSTGNLGTPAQMDLRCTNDANNPMDGATFKAVVADGETRCTGGGACTDWPVRPGLQYFWPGGTVAGRANTNGAIPTLTVPINIGTHEFWTGLTASWATANSLCALVLSDPWTASNTINSGATGLVSPTQATVQDGTPTLCNQQREVWCVED